MAKAGRAADQYMLRLPDGLRDRIKAYSERAGTSINSEIVRVLEREFPPQWPIDNRLAELGQLMDVLAAGRSAPRLNDFVKKFEETVKGIITGRVTGVDAATREEVMDLWRSYKSRKSEAEYEEAVEDLSELSEDEIEILELTGSHEKFAVPPPKRPNPLLDNYLLMDVIPRGPLSEIAEMLAKGDTEGAAEILRRVPKSDIEKHIKFRELSIFEQDRLRESRDAEAVEINYDPFKFPSDT